MTAQSGPGHLRVRPHGLGGVEVEIAEEHPQPAEETPQRGRQHPLAPLDSAQQAAVTRVGRIVADQEAESVVEATKDVRRGHGGHAAGRELQRQRHVIEGNADVGDQRTFRWINAHRGIDAPRALHEQSFRGIRRERTEVQDLLPGDGEGLPAGG
jgi:hypothetical protein